jgi:hypothetical protein
VDVDGYFIEAGQQLEVCNMGGGRQRSGQGRAGQGARRGEAERARDSGCLAWADRQLEEESVRLWLLVVHMVVKNG